MPALALILHVIDGVDAGVGGPVSGVAAERAAAWCRYLEAHAGGHTVGDLPASRPQSKGESQAPTLEWSEPMGWPVGWTWQ
jgi:hypothetical protein